MAVVNTLAFDARAQRRRSMIGKVKVAQKALGLVEDDYRAMLMLHTGKSSAANCSEPELAKMLDAMKAAGFKAVVKNGSRNAPAANNAPARKARAMWISLAQLGAVHNSSELALETFAKRQLNVQALAWADAGIMYKLIEALKAIAQRNGWNQSLEGVAPSQTLHALKLRLCEAILLKLKDAELVPMQMGLKQAAWSLCGLEDERGVGPMLWSAEHLDILAKGLAAKLRQAMPPVRAAEIAR